MAKRAVFLKVIQSMLSGFHSVCSGGSMPVFNRYKQPINRGLALDWRHVGEHIIPAIERCQREQRRR